MEQSIEKVVILNIHGQILKAATSASKEISMPIGEMQKGIYMVQAKMTDGRRWTGRFVKQQGWFFRLLKQKNIYVDGRKMLYVVISLTDDGITWPNH